jgi:tape measure domain-containing protein
MALQIKIDAAQAQQALNQIEASLTKLEAALNKVGSNTAVKGTLTELAGFKGIAGVDSVVQLGNALTALANNKNMTAVMKTLQEMSKLNLSQAVSQVQGLANALNSINAGNIIATSAALKSLATSTQQATTATQQFAAAKQASNAATTQKSASIQILSNNTKTYTTNVQNASAASKGFGESLSGVQGALAAFGVALGAAGFAQFISHAVDAAAQVQKFQAQMINLGGAKDGVLDLAKGTKIAGEQLMFLRAVAQETGFSFVELLGVYGRFVQNAVQSGFAIGEAAEMFRKLSSAFRVLGLSTEDAKGAFKAFEQMLAKGGITAEEMRQQLGDRGVAAMGLLQKALGMTSEQLEKYMKQMKNVDDVKKFIDLLDKVTKAGLDVALRTWIAQVGLFQNAVDALAATFGQFFTQTLLPGMTSLREAFELEEVKVMMQELGKLFGGLASGAAQFFADLVQATAAVVNFAAAALTNMETFRLWLQWWNDMTEAKRTAVEWIGYVITAFTALAAAGMMIWMLQKAWAGVMLAIGAIQLLLSMTLMKFLLIAAAIGFVVAVIASFVNGTSIATEMSKMFEGAMVAVTEKAADLTKGMTEVNETYDKAAPKIKMSTEERDKERAAINARTQEGIRMNQNLQEETAARGRADAAWQKYNSTVNDGSAKSQKALEGLRKAADDADRQVQELRTKHENGWVKIDLKGDAQRELDALKLKLGEIDGFVAEASVMVNYKTGTRESSNVIDARQSGPTYGTTQGTALPKNSVDTGSGTKMPTVDQFTGGTVTQPNWDWGMGDSGGSDSVFGGSWGEVDNGYKPDYGSSTGDGGDPYYTGGSGGYSYEGDYQEYAKGGIVGSRPATKRISSSVFAGAPGYETGTANTSGGIPIIAHPDEAVIPLPDGKSVPVSMSGKSDQLQAVKETTDAVRMFHAAWLDSDKRNYAELVSISNALVTIQAKLTPPPSTSSGGGSGSGGGAGTDTGGGKKYIDPKTGIKMIGKGGLTNLLGDLDNPMGVKSMSPQKWTVETVDSNYSNSGSGSAFGYGGGSKMPSFAVGTPNTSRDGIPAILHPNEAVIPLPDGRRVPVEMRGGSGGGDITVNMTVVTKDADSFRKSKDQLMQELRSELERTDRNLGTPRRGNDPTRKRT